MSRTVSPEATRALFAQHTDQAFWALLQFSHADWVEPFRFVNDRADHDDAGGNTWQGFPFEITLPDDRDDELGVAQLVIDNVDRQIVQTIRSIQSPATVQVWVVRSGDIDDVVAGPYEFSLNKASWNALTVSADLEHEPILNMMYPQHAFTPITVPGLFKQ